MSVGLEFTRRGGKYNPCEKLLLCTKGVDPQHTGKIRVFGFLGDASVSLHNSQRLWLERLGCGRLGLDC